MTTTEPQKTKEQIIKEKYPHLAGQNITLSDAAEKYGLPRSTVKSWVYQSKYLAPIDPDAYPMFVNEAEIAYLVDIYNGRKRTNSKAPLVDDNGLPYKLKRPRLAQYRKNKKTTP